MSRPLHQYGIITLGILSVVLCSLFVLSQDSVIAAGKKKKKPPFPSDKAVTIIRGSVLFKGDMLKRKALEMKGDSFCEECHKDKPHYSEDLIVNEDKQIKNVFVYVSKGADQWKHEVPKEPIKVDQVNCLYVPHVFGVMAKQKLLVTSSDETTHNVHFVGKRNKEINITQKKGQEDELVFKRAETMAILKCDMHSWMKSYVGILSHPFYSVTDEEGKFELAKLPPGEYEITAWHETLGTRTVKAVINDEETQEMEFVFEQQ